MATLAGLCELIALAVSSATAPAQPPPAVVEARVVVVQASGRSLKAAFDAAVPKDLRAKLEGSRLAYGSYKLLAKVAKPAPFGKEVTFPLPNGENLAIKVAPNPSRSHPLRVSTRILDSKKRLIQKTQLLIPYDKTFLLHRPTGASAIIMGISAHKVGGR